uniref:Uncharacterized protein n=1 Tax=Caenorhabditis japonica TaxID=281687 RepID=A0A8R1DFG7_CAEJA
MDKLIFSTDFSGKHVTGAKKCSNYANIAEKAEFYTKFAANSNRFWTGNLILVQENEEISKIQISSDNWKTASVEEDVVGDLDSFFANLFQKFAYKLYNNQALYWLPVFDASIFDQNRHSLQDYDLGRPEHMWERRVENQMYTYALFVKKTTFEDYEATLKFVDALKRIKQHGFFTDCKKNTGPCNTHEQSDKPMLMAFEDDNIAHIYLGDFQQDHVYDWMLTIQQPEVTILNENMVPQYRSGIVPGFSQPRDTVITLFINTKKSQVWRNYKKFAKQRFGGYHLTAVISKEVEKWSFYPAFITMKPNDEYVKAFTLYKDITFDRMTKYIEDSRYPGCHKLESTHDFINAIKAQKPLLIFYDAMNTKNVTKFKYAASHEQGIDRTVQFAAITGFLIIPLSEEIEDFKFPIARFNLWERHEDVEELEKELTQVQKNRDEL